MPKRDLAIVNCRVSSTEQLENNSLNRQREAVLRAAEELGAEIPGDGWWSGSVSSKRGTNVNRKDLNEMLERCKKDKRIKYLIVDEPDRFMRSIDEAAYFEVAFRQLGVTVWYASDPELNKGDLSSKLLKFTKYLSAEGSNEERQHKSIVGQEKALAEGRYPFPPKPGYKRGYERAVPEIDPVKGPALKRVLLRIADRIVTPTDGLIELNKSEFMVGGHSLYKMDKFRKIATDPFYAGVVEINKQVKYRNENGRHQALISMEQHVALVSVFNDKRKTQTGPRKNGNPKYPMNNLVDHDLCKEQQYGRIVGVDIHNGKNRQKIYEKYRCRACKASLPRNELHAKIEDEFNKNPISEEGIKSLTAALRIVWRKKEGQLEQDKVHIAKRITQLKESISVQALAAIDPANAIVKNEILTSVATKKRQVEDLEHQLDNMSTRSKEDEERFLTFALNFAKSMGTSFLDPSLSEVNRKRCKQIIFPAGFKLDENKNVYTPQVSRLIRLATNKKDLPVTEKSLMVRVQRL